LAYIDPGRDKMSDRKKRGVAFLIGGIVTTIVGVVFLQTEITPEWVSIGIAIVGNIAEIFGFSVVMPDTD